MKKLNLTDEERKEHEREISRKAYQKAKRLKKYWTSSEAALKRWYSIPEERRKQLQKERNAKRRAKHPNESAEGMRKWRELHGEEERRKEQDYRRKNKQRSIEYLGGKCVKCNGVFHPDVYDFHHIDEKEKDVCVGRLLGRNFERITNELDKCILVCANCHRVIHAQY